MNFFNDFINDNDYMKLNKDTTIVGDYYGNKSNGMSDGMIEHLLE